MDSMSLSSVLAAFQATQKLAVPDYPKADADEFQVFYEIPIEEKKHVLRVAFDRQGMPLFVVRDIEAVLGLPNDDLAKSLRRYSTEADPTFLFHMRGFTAKTQECAFWVVCDNTGIAKMAAFEYNHRARTKKAQEIFKLVFAWICALRATIKLDSDGKTPILQPFALGVVGRLVNMPAKRQERVMKPQFMQGFSMTFAPPPPRRSKRKLRPPTRTQLHS